MSKSFLGIILKCSPINMCIFMSHKFPHKTLKECTQDYLLSICVYIGTTNKRMLGEIFYFYAATDSTRVQKITEVEMSFKFLVIYKHNINI